MGLNKHMMIEEHELEWEIAELRGEGEGDDEWWAFEDADEPTEADLARADKLERRLDDLRRAQCGYNRFLGGVVVGEPAPGVSPRFRDHVEGFESIQNADADD
jgi:hypothetical protein